jgi:hypothetical protein
VERTFACFLKATSPFLSDRERSLLCDKGDSRLV